MSISVTFDSNVWETVVDEEKRSVADQSYTRLFNSINQKLITPYFVEGLITLETIRRKDRKDFFTNSKPGYSISVDGDEVLSVEGTQSPQISDYLNRVVPQALKMGFRFIRLPRIGMP